MTIADSPLAGADVRTLSNASFDDGTLTLDFTPTSGDGAVTTIEAGKPYIIKWASGSNLTQADLVFNSKTISAATHDVSITLVNTEGEEKSIIFRGTYAKASYTEENKSVLFLGTGNTLYYPSAKVTIGAQRAYFQLKGITAGDKANEARSFILNFGEESSGVTSPFYYREGQGAEPSWFTLDGRKLNGMPTTKGVYINNGKKVVIK